MKLHSNSACKAVALTLVATLLTVGCAVPPGQVDPTVLGRADALVRQSDPSWLVHATAEPAQVRIGSPITLKASANSNGYLYIFQLSSDGRTLSLLFPNAVDGANYLPAGATLQLPRANWRMAARGPAGMGYLMSVVTEQAQDLRALDSALAEQRLAITGRYGATLSTVREVTP
jgi:hypothetical protein